MRPQVRILSFRPFEAFCFLKYEPSIFSGGSYFFVSFVYRQTCSLSGIVEIHNDFEVTILQVRIGVIMGSKSDYETMRHTTEILRSFSVPFEVEIVSAHRTPDKLYNYAKTARARGVQIIIAGAGGAAHLPGMVAAMTTLPVIGVPVQSKALQGMDSLLSIVQMPAGVPVATVAIGVAGAKNAALLALQILSIFDEEIAKRLEVYRATQTQGVLQDTIDE